MRIKTVIAVLSAGLLSLNANAGFEQFDLKGVMDVYDSAGTTYLDTYSPYALEDLRALTSDERTFVLLPNVNLYADNPGDPYWRSDGGTGLFGNKILEANTVFEIESITPDITNVVFEFTLDQYNLIFPDYQLTAFIQVLDKVGGSFMPVGTPVEITPDEFKLYRLELPISVGWTNQLLQAGWTLRGVNANPDLVEAYGTGTVTAVTLEAQSDDTTPPSPDPMGFAIEPYALSGTNITMTASNATDAIYDVQYQFSNTVTLTLSDWQSSPTWIDIGPLNPTTNEVEKIVDPTFLDLNGNWSAFVSTLGSQDPSSFVTVSGGVATVTPGSSAEWNFYQEFNGVLNEGQEYEFSIVSDNSTVAGDTPVAFVKAFEPGYNFQGDELQLVPLSLDGTATTINFTVQPGSTIYQVGVLTDSATSGSYDVSDPSLTTQEIDPGGTGLTPDTEYEYVVRARDTSPQLNETAWSAPVAATSTVTDVTAPTPDPMEFFIAPFAISDTAISMTASNAVDDSFGVEYLFTNIVNHTSSGWQSSPTWVNVGELALVNPDFEDAGDPGTGWSFDSGGAGTPSGATTTNISGNTSALTYVDGTISGGGFAVIVQAVTNLSATGFSGGDTVTLSADIRALAGLNGGGALLKMESWSGGAIIAGSALEVQIPGTTESWDNYSMEYTIASGADEVRVVAGTATAYGGANATDSYYLFDNLAVSKGVSLEPGTEYTYWVKARDTSPNNNETDWSDPASATTTGQGPFSIDSIEFVDGVGIILTWPNVVGSTYDVQYKTALTNATWLSDPGATGISSAAGSISATSTVDSASVFYQVIAE